MITTVAARPPVGVSRLAALWRALRQSACRWRLLGGLGATGEQDQVRVCPVKGPARAALAAAAVGLTASLLLTFRVRWTDAAEIRRVAAAYAFPVLSLGAFVLVARY